MAGPAKKPWKRNDESINEADRLALAADLSAQRGEYEDADKLYDRAIALVPGNADLWALKGINLSGGLHRDDDARRCWDRARQLDPLIGDAFRDIDVPDENQKEVLDAHYAKPAGGPRQGLRDLLKE